MELLNVKDLHVTVEEKEILRQCIEENCPGAEIYFIDGGQEIYPYIFVAE